MKRKKATNKDVGLALEKLDAMGHANEKEGIKWTQFFMDQFDKETWEKDQIQLDRLEHSRRFTKRNYFYLLAQMLNEEAHDLDTPSGYLVGARSTLDGVVLEVIDRSGICHRRAYTPCGTPKIDYECAVVCLIQAQNTIDKKEEEYYKRTHTVDGMKKTESGILLS